jgi:hypothetical protein
MVRARAWREAEVEEVLVEVHASRMRRLAEPPLICV